MKTLGFIVLLIALFVGGFLYYLDNLPVDNADWNIRVGVEMEELRAQFKEQNKSAFIVGYTGEVGKQLAREILTSGVFSRLVLIGRREIKFEDDLYKDVEQKVVNFDKLDEHADVFEGLDVGFCCLGTTRGKSGAAGYYKVDHDYVMSTAQQAKKGGCSHFQLVSSQGANKNSFFLYTKTKGEVEEELKAMEFDRLSIFRPGALLCKREERRMGERVIIGVFTPIFKAFPTAMSVETTAVAAAMVNCAVSPAPTDDKKWELFENKAIHQLAGDSK